MRSTAARRAWGWTRLAIGAGILVVLVRQLGTDPFVDALQRIDGWSLAAATGVAVATTACCAWRWRLVSRGLGTDLPLRTAVTAYYRSQFLNTVLPGGVLGDAHRAVRRGRDVGDVGHGVRGVVWERAAGQVVQVALTVAVLLLLPSPVRPAMPAVLVAAVVLLLVAGVVCRWLCRSGASVLARTTRAVVADARTAVLRREAWPAIVVASTAVVAGHVLVFLLAARAVGSTASTLELVPLALLVLLAMALPTSIAGWGPREGMAAWVFALAGLGAAQGLAIAVAYGVLALVATLPGAVLGGGHVLEGSGHG